MVVTLWGLGVPPELVRFSKASFVLRSDVDSVVLQMLAQTPVASGLLHRVFVFPCRVPFAPPMAKKGRGSSGSRVKEELREPSPPAKRARTSVGKGKVHGELN